MPRSAADRDATYFPAFLDLVRKRVVVVGGGSIATGKVRGLLPCRPRPLVVVAPTVSPYIADLADLGLIDWLPRAYADGDLDGADLAFAATDDRALNARVAADARARHTPVLAVDDVPNCDFIAPALVRRGQLTLAISTSGRSPAMARRAREHLDTFVPTWWATLLDIAAQARDELGEERRGIDPQAWQVALGGEVERLAAAGHVPEATALLLERLRASAAASAQSVQSSNAELTNRPRGRVTLVGAGPGDPELLTVRALARLREADAIVYDRLVSPEILDLAPPTAERFAVGKQPHGGGASQASINDLLVSLGREGRSVVRLKGGDPLVFGRGGEEMLALRAAGVAYEIVPGVSSALAAPAAAEIPLTHRGLSSAFSVITGHAAADTDTDAAAADTLVVLMAIERLEETVARLLREGRSRDEPAAIVEQATTPRQRVIRATLADIACAARQAKVEAPAVLVVGPTVALARAQKGLLPGRQDRDERAPEGLAHPAVAGGGRGRGG